MPSKKKLRKSIISCEKKKKNLSRSTGGSGSSYLAAFLINLISLLEKKIKNIHVNLVKVIFNFCLLHAAP